MRATTPAGQRVLARADQSGGPDACWHYTGRLLANGYGVVSRGRRGDGQTTASRAAWELVNGPAPAGMEVDHVCHNDAVRRGECVDATVCGHRRCVNPAHLQLVTPSENASRSGLRVADACANGHPYTIDNIHSYRGYRRCRACNRENAARQRAKQRDHQ